MCGTSSFQEEDWQLDLKEGVFSCEMTGAQDRGMTTDPAEAENDEKQLGLQEMEFPHEVTHAQEELMTADLVEAQGISARSDGAEGESEQEQPA